MNDDTRILQLYRDGQCEEAFNCLVKAYSERLFWQVRPLCATHDDADDLIQEIFMKIWTALPSFRGEAQLYTWCWRIAMNTAVTFMKKRSRRPFMESVGTAGDEPADPLGAVSSDPYFDGDEAQRLLQSAILSLPPRQRVVFSMRYYDEMSYEEMSRVLGTSVSSLKASFHFAQEKVRRFVTGKISR